MPKGEPALIAYADHATDIGGAEVSLRLLLRCLDPQRFRPMLLHAPGAAWLGDAATADIPAAAVFPPDPGSQPRRESLHPSLAANLGHIARALRPVMAVRRALLRARPALVHSNTLKCHLMAGLAARACRLPVVWHMRDIVPEPGAWAMLARVARMVRPRVIAISEAVARHVRPLGLPITVVHNGVPLDDFAPGEPSPALRAELGLRPEHRVLMVVSRLTPWKGHRQLLEAMPAVLERFTDARLVVVGTTAFWDDAYADELRTLAGRLGLADAVVWTGHRKDVPDLLRLCEVFVLPSRDEPFGRAIVEAMATGKPVVAGRAGGVPEICPDGECGHLVDPEDAAGIAEALVALLAEPDRAREMGLAGLARAREHFDARVTAEKVQSVYEEVLAGGA